MSDAKPVTLRLEFGEEDESGDSELQFHADESDGEGLWIAVRVKWLANDVGVKAYVDYKCLESFHAEVERYFKGAEVETRLYDTDCSFEARFILGPSRRDGKVSLAIQHYGCEGHPGVTLRVTDAMVSVADINDFVQEASRWLTAR